MTIALGRVNGRGGGAAAAAAAAAAVVADGSRSSNGGDGRAPVRFCGGTGYVDLMAPAPVAAGATAAVAGAVLAVLACRRGVSPPFLLLHLFLLLFLFFQRNGRRRRESQRQPPQARQLDRHGAEKEEIGHGRCRRVERSGLNSWDACFHARGEGFACVQDHKGGLGGQVAQEKGEKDRREGSQSVGWHVAADDDAAGFLGEGGFFCRLLRREDGDNGGKLVFPMAFPAPPGGRLGAATGALRGAHVVCVWRVGVGGNMCLSLGERWE